MDAIEKLLKEIDSDKHLTLGTTVALDSLGCNIVPKLRERISYERKNKMITEDDIWDMIKNDEINNTIVRQVLFRI